MDNLHRAFEAIAAANDGFTAPEVIPGKALENLHYAGLITPDAPQPYFEYAGGPIWEVNNGYSIEKERPGEITVSYHGEPAEPITPQEARQLAAALLAAANYAEEE